VIDTIDWGIPNWTKPEGYPAKDTTDTWIWGWEFLRRSPEYRFFWMEKIKPFRGVNGWIDRDEAGNFWPYHEELKTRFGVDLPSPPQSSVPSYFVANSISYLSNHKGREFQKVSLKEHEIAIIIDLTRPLKKQLKMARDTAERQQKHLLNSSEITLRNARSQASLYVSYLRILDAEESGAQSKMIADLLFPGVPDEYPDRRRINHFYEARDAAQKMRDGGYRSLLEAK
jgi:Uncharacterized conserved protein (DUF2285)